MQHSFTTPEVQQLLPALLLPLLQRQQQQASSYQEA
jgi:hypothetical protein